MNTPEHHQPDGRELHAAFARSWGNSCKKIWWDLPEETRSFSEEMRSWILAALIDCKFTSVHVHDTIEFACTSFAGTEKINQ